jgi:hypothetical protein
MDKNWKENVYVSIKEFADLDKQRRLWHGVDPGYASSFDEDVSLLLDSFSFEEFLIELENENFQPQILNDMVTFKEMLKDYKRKDNHMEILNDPAWLAIVEKAGHIIQQWSLEIDFNGKADS